VLLIAASPNVALLLLGSGAERLRELAVRAARVEPMIVMRS